MKFRLITFSSSALLGSALFASNAIADYSAHQFHYMEMELSKCKEIATEISIKAGI